MSEEIRRIDRKLIHHGAVVDFYEDTMQLPDGNTATWDFISHKGAAAVVAVQPDGRLLMVRQYRGPIDRYTLEIPAGKLDYAGEDTLTCAARELHEETGYTADHMERLLSIFTTVGFCNEHIDIYLATGLHRGEQHLDYDEYLNVEAYELGELIDRINRFEIEDSKTVSGLLAYAARAGH